MLSRSYANSELLHTVTFAAMSTCVHRCITGMLSRSQTVCFSRCTAAIQTDPCIACLAPLSVKLTAAQTCAAKQVQWHSGQGLTFPASETHPDLVHSGAGPAPSPARLWRPLLAR